MSSVDAAILCGDKIVQIPLSNGEFHEIHGEQCEAHEEHLMSALSREASVASVLVVRDF